MRWDQLFDDLAVQLDQAQREEERALALEEERLRQGRLTLRERIAAMQRGGGAVRLELVGGRVVVLRGLGFGRDWIAAELVDSSSRMTQLVVPLSAIAAVLPERGQLEQSLEPQPEASARLSERIGLAFVLRDLCRRRTPVRLVTLDGEAHGTFDRVLRDHVELALHEPGAPRREREVRGYRLVPFERIVSVGF
ncbi:hypothetical protein ACWKWP_06655 [Agromyces soli]